MSGWRSKYGEHFPCCAAIEAIRAHMDQAYKKQLDAAQEIKFLSDMLVRRSRELQAGTWPEKRHDGGGQDGGPDVV